MNTDTGIVIHKTFSV